MQIFIGGTGRSGTSIVGRSLGKHEDIFYPTLKMGKRTFGPEMRFLIDPDGCIDLINNLSENWSPQRASESLKRFSILIDKIFKKSYLGSKYLNYIFARVLLPKIKMSGPSYSFSFLGDIFPRKSILKLTEDFIENRYLYCQNSDSGSTLTEGKANGVEKNHGQNRKEVQCLHRRNRRKRQPAARRHGYGPP